MIRRTRTNKKVAEWLTAIKSNNQHEPQNCSLQPRFQRAEKHYSESSAASSEAAAEGAGPRRGGRRRERGRARSEGAGAGKGDPLRVLEELKRLSEDEASPYPSSSSSPAGAPPSPPGPCSRSSSSSGGAALGPLPGRRARRVLRGRSLSPLNFRPARDLSRSALRRIYSLPNDRAARRRRFKEELRRRCGLKVWTWEELVRGGRAALADACRVPTPDDQERLRFRYRSYSPRKMHGVMCGVRAALREDERRVDRLFAELERLMLPADDGPDAAATDAGGAGAAAAALVVERRRLMALRGGRGQGGGDGGGDGGGEGGGGGGGGALRGRFVSDLSLTRAHWVRARSGGAASRARGHAAKAFERRTLLYLDWEPSDASAHSAHSARTRGNKPGEARRKKANAKCKVQEVKRSSHKHPAPKTCEATKRPSRISEFTYPANGKHESKKDSIKMKEDLRHEAALPSVGRRKTPQGARRSAPDAPRGGSLEAPSAAFRLSAAPAQRQPARLPPLQETAGDKAALCKETDKNANQKTSARSNNLHKRMQALKNSFSEIKEIHGTGDDRINIYEATSRVLQRTGRQRASSWTRPPSSKAPLPPLREQRMYARAVACAADSDPFPKKESFAPLGNDSRHATYHF